MRHFYETFLRDFFMKNLYDIFKWEILMRLFNETFWLHVLMIYIFYKTFDDTFLWDILIRHFVDTTK